MVPNLLFFILLLASFTSFGQAKKDWQAGYQLSVLDFQAEAPASSVGQGQTYYLAAHLNFNYAKPNAVTPTPDWNKSVTAFFMPESSWLQQGEGTEILLQYAQMDFDLLELYARKFRQRLYRERHALTNPNLFQQARDGVNTELAKRRVEMQNAAAASDNKGEAFHEQILKEIAALAEFCQECKLDKKNN